MLKAALLETETGALAGLADLIRQLPELDLVVATHDLAELAQHFIDKPPALLFSDFTFARRFSQLFPDAVSAPALVVVGGREHQAYRALALGAFDFIDRPSRERLATTVRKYRQISGQ